MRTISSNTARLRERQRGMTLIELMVGIVISMLLSLAVFTLMSVSESRKRTTTSTNDINQTGNYAIYLLDKLVRGAGSGLGQAADYAFGCKLLAAKGTQLLPRTQALPAPFADINTGAANVFRLAPVLIAQGQTRPMISNRASDALIVMSSASGLAPVPVPFAETATEAALNLVSTMNFSAGDLVLLADSQPSEATGGPADCLVEQVASSFSTGGATSTLPLGGDYYTTGVTGTGPTTYRDKYGRALPLGNVLTGNTPAFLMIGVGDHNTLYSYDLLQTTAAPLTPIVDSVFEMHALYGVDTNGDGKIDKWVSPTTSSGYGLSTLMDGSAAATGLLRQIRAVRVGLIMRTSLPEKEAVASAQPKLFADLGTELQYEREWASDDEMHYRYRTFETTIPVRNTLLLE